MALCSLIVLMCYQESTDSLLYSAVM